MDKFEQEEMKKESTAKNTWYDGLINYIPEAVRKRLGDFKDKDESLFTQTQGKKLSKPKR